MATHQIKVAKVTEEELKAFREWLQDLNGIIDDAGIYHEDMDKKVRHKINQEITDAAIKIPSRSFLIPLNLGVLLDNYQDKNSTILEHPVWIKEMIELLSEINEFINSDNQLVSGSKLHNKIKTILNGE